MVSKALSALARFAWSSDSSFCDRPQVQSLQARRRLPALGRHSGAEKKKSSRVSVCGDDSARKVAENGAVERKQSF